MLPHLALAFPLLALATYAGGYVREPPPTAASVAPPFTYVVLPDTQWYTMEWEGVERCRLFKQQTQWIADNYIKAPNVQNPNLNIAFVSHLGDIVQSESGVSERDPGLTEEKARRAQETRKQWSCAEEAMAKLTQHHVPFGLAPGNHDYNVEFGYRAFDSSFACIKHRSGFPCQGDLQYFDKEFIPSCRNNYELFEVGPLKFVVLHIEHNMPPRAMEWAVRVLKRYCHRLAIIQTHAFLDELGLPPAACDGSDPNKQPGECTPPAEALKQLVGNERRVVLIVSGHSNRCMSYETGQQAEPNRDDPCGIERHAVWHDGRVYSCDEKLTCAADIAGCAAAMACGAASTSRAAVDDVCFKGKNGKRTVHMIVSDYQNRGYNLSGHAGGDGWLRYYTFHPSDGKVCAVTYNTNSNLCERDADSAYCFDVDLDMGDESEACRE